MRVDRQQRSVSATAMLMIVLRLRRHRTPTHNYGVANAKPGYERTDASPCQHIVPAEYEDFDLAFGDHSDAVERF